MKRIIALMLLLCMVLSVTACAAAPAPETTAAAQPTEAAVQETQPTETVPAKYPLAVTDQAGRVVTIAQEPQRIVSGYYISTSAVIALGLKDRLVGVEAKADKRAIYKLSAPELIDLPSVGTAKEFDLEGCIALNPDFVILSLKQKGAAESLEALGIPVVLVNPESSVQMLAMLDLIAEAANAEDTAAQLKAFIIAQEIELMAISDAPSVYLGGNSDFLSTAGAAMYQSDMIRLAGGINAAEEITDTYWAQISYEQLLAWDPDYIVLASDAAYTVEDVLNDPNLAACRAVQNGNVVHLPNHVESWDSPIPSAILGSVWLASVLHPDQWSAEHAEEIITQFYSEFYGFVYHAE